MEPITITISFKVALIVTAIVSYLFGALVCYIFTQVM